MIATTRQIAEYRFSTRDFSAPTASLILEPTLRTPYVNYSSEYRTLTIKGRSTDDNAVNFYKPVMELLQRDVENQKAITLDLHIQRLNTATVKVLFDLFKYLKLKKMAGMTIEVIWRTSFKNHEMWETGYDLSDLYDLDFRMISE